MDDILARLRSKAVSLNDPSALQYVREMQKAFPEAVLHRQVLQALGCDFTYAKKDEVTGCWAAIVELNAELQQMLGCSVGIVAYYTPYRDLQTRTVDRMRRLQLGRRYETHIFLMSSPDVLAERKLDEWTLNEPFAVALLRSNGSPSDLARTLIREVVRKVSKSNPYERTSPVVGNEFYGRRLILQQLVSELRHGRVCGVFGLRKTGKTSLVTELGRQFEADDAGNRVFVLRDLEVLPSDPERQVPQLCSDIARQLSTAFKSTGIRTHELANLPAIPSVGELRQAVQASLTHSSARDKTVVLALDEIESLVGPDAISSSSKPLVAEFFGAIRSLVQEIHSFNVIISGITVTPLRNSTLYGRENPLFAWAKPLFVSFLPVAEAQEMVESLGARMALSWSSEAVAEVLDVTGGHVFLTRSYAAAVAEGFAGDISQRHVEVADVRASRRAWRREISVMVDSMIEALERFYPLELDVLALADDAEIAGDLDEEYPSEVHNLISLGLLVEGSESLHRAPWVSLGSRFRGA